MKITAPDLTALGLVDEVVQEPPGGAHVNPERSSRPSTASSRQLRELSALSREALLEARYQKFRQMGRAGREFLQAS